MLNTSYKRIQQRIAAIKAEADVSTGKPSKGKGAGARGGEQIAGNLYRSQSGEFQAGPAGQLRARIEAIREMRKAKAKKPKGGKGKGKPAAEKDERTPQEIANQNRAMIAEATGMADLEGVIVRLGAGMDSEAEKEAHDKLIGQGLAKRNADGSVTLTPAGKAWRRAADKGDQDGAATAIAEGKAGVANKDAKDKERADKQEAREKEKSGGGSKDKKKPAKEKPEKEETEPAADKEAAAQAKKESNRAAVAEKMMANDAGVTKKGMDALASLASGEGAVDAGTVDALAEMGLAERAKDGTPRLTTQGRAAVRAAEQGDYGAAVDAISRAADAATERREQATEQAALEAEAPSDEELVSEAAATVGLEDGDVDDLRSAADEGGASNATLQAAGLVDKDGAATAEGVDALEALERGDIRGYRRAARKARARVRREKSSADKAGKDKQQAVEEEVARIDTARGRGGADRGRGILRPTATKAQEQAHTGVMVALFTPELAGLPGVTEPQDDLHITLAYLGNTDDIQLARRKDRLIACLTAWAASEPPLIGVVNGLGRFFNAESDGTNAVYAAPDVASLPDARQRLIRCLERAGIFAASNHGFTPHITLAYVPSDAPTPDIRPRDIPIALDAAWLAWGDERIAFPFGGATKAMWLKHGKHDQSTHGRSTARRAGARAAYSTARAAGASPAEARAEANNVSAIHHQQQRMANITRQLEGEISEKQRSSLGAEYERLKSDTRDRVSRVRDNDQSNQLLNMNPEPNVRGRMGALHDYEDRLSLARNQHQQTQNRLADAKRDLAYKEDIARQAQNAGGTIRRMHERERNEAKREVRRLENEASAQERLVRKNERLYEGELARPQLTQRRAEIMGERAYLRAHREGRPQDAARERDEATARVLERKPLRAPISGDRAAETAFRRQRQEAAALRQQQRERDKAFRDKARANSTRIAALQKELNNPRTPMARLQEIQQELGNIRAGKAINMPAAKMTTLPTVADLLTAQIGRERYASAFYTALATWADAAGYDGLKAWADREAVSEMGHANTLIAYGRDRDITGLAAIPAPPTTFGGYTTALAQALDLERQVSAALQSLTTTARGVGDEPTALVASDLLRGQVESEKELKTLIQRAARADTTTLDLLDHELMEAA